MGDFGESVIDSDVLGAIERLSQAFQVVDGVCANYTQDVFKELVWIDVHLKIAQDLIPSQLQLSLNYSI